MRQWPFSIWRNMYLRFASGLVIRSLLISCPIAPSVTFVNIAWVSQTPVSCLSDSDTERLLGHRTSCCLCNHDATVCRAVKCMTFDMALCLVFQIGGNTLTMDRYTIPLQTFWAEERSCSDPCSQHCRASLGYTLNPNCPKCHQYQNKWLLPWGAI